MSPLKKTNSRVVKKHLKHGMGWLEGLSPACLLGDLAYDLISPSAWTSGGHCRRASQPMSSTAYPGKMC